MRLFSRISFGRGRLPGPVFVSYRRADTTPYSGRIHDALAKRYGEKNVFMDLQGIEPSHDFMEVIDGAVKSSFALLAVIGPGWLRPPPAEDGIAPREDYVLREVATALQAGIPVFPVLVGGARMPEVESLPAPVRRLAQLQAVELSDLRWKYDLQQLIEALERRARSRAARGQTLRAARIAVPASLLLALSVWTVPKLRTTPPDQPLEPGAVSCRSRSFPMVYADGRRLSIDRDAFLRGYEAEFGKQTELARSGLGTVLSMIASDTSVTDGRWAAYMLATIKHETNGTWLPFEEPGKGEGRKYGQPVAVTDSLGNRYTHAYYGRGYVSLTWDYNYRQMGMALDRALLYDPSLALEPEVAYAVASLGMRKGAFTGMRLSNYINGETCDYVNARKVINGLYNAERIAGDAATLEEILARSIALRRYKVLPDTLTLHSGPDSASPPRLVVLTRGRVVPVVNEQGGWMQVRLERSGLMGWVPSASLQAVEPER